MLYYSRSRSCDVLLSVPLHWGFFNMLCAGYDVWSFRNGNGLHKSRETSKTGGIVGPEDLHRHSNVQYENEIGKSIFLCMGHCRLVSTLDAAH